MKPSKLLGVRGLNYFPLDVDFLNDYKIQEINEHFGAKGIIVYLSMLCKIYKEGFCLNMALNELGYIISRDLGAEQYPVDEVCEILRFFTIINLLDKESAKFGWLTSTGIQRRHYLVSHKSKCKLSDYFLLSE